jgi:hypothetical protein
MIIFLLTIKDNTDDEQLIGIFSSKERLESFCKKLPEQEFNEPIEVNIDDVDEVPEGDVYYVQEQILRDQLKSTCVKQSNICTRRLPKTIGNIEQGKQELFNARSGMWNNQATGCTLIASSVCEARKKFKRLALLKKLTEKCDGEIFIENNEVFWQYEVHAELTNDVENTLTSISNKCAEIVRSLNCQIKDEWRDESSTGFAIVLPDIPEN